MMDQLIEHCKHILQRDVKFMLDDKKILRRGKLLLFNTTDFYITFTILTNKNQQKVYEVFYPYGCEHDKSRKRVELSYKISDMCNDPEVQELLQDIPKDDCHTFHDSVISIYYDV